MKAESNKLKEVMTKAHVTGERNGYPLQGSCLENPMNRGVWQATVPGVAKSRLDMTE